MPYSHHSHSGQFCPGHARDQLEEVILKAISLDMHVFAVTEHMPREKQDFYPEERNGVTTPESLLALHNAFYEEAVQLREKYKGQIDILIGFEADWIRAASKSFIEQLLFQHKFDFYVSSVHHVHTIPIDYNKSFYNQARAVSGGTDEKLFEDYFDAQFAMLEALKPPVIGHFDLIRLFSDDPERSFRQWPRIWLIIIRNLDYIVSYGGVLEINSSSLRKGMNEPYPKLEICQEFARKGGRFCLSDDSHGVDQVGLNYHLIPQFIEKSGIQRLHYLQRLDEPTQEPVFPRFPATYLKAIDIAQLKQHSIFF